MRKRTVNVKKKKHKQGVLSMVIGLLLIAAALTLVLYNVWDAKRAEKTSAKLVKKLELVMPDETPDVPADESPDMEAVRLPEKEQDISGYVSSCQEMKKEEIEGYLYIGILDIPGLDLRLPVMAEWDYERLKISPCLYSGSYYSDDMVICAHNYAKHFSPVKWIDMGEDVYFTTVDGSVYHYQVSNRETVRGTAAEDMLDQTREDWDLTLFTCNTGGQTRCAVRCIRVP